MKISTVVAAIREIVVSAFFAGTSVAFLAMAVFAAVHHQWWQAVAAANCGTGIGWFTIVLISSGFAMRRGQRLLCSDGGSI